MERFLPILSAIQARLREILARNEDYMSSWNVAKIDNIGEDLLKLARDVYPQLIEVEHRILFQSLREAGMGIRARVAEIRRGELKEEDKAYFRNVHEALGNICGKIESGEYYRALLDVAEKREKERSLIS
jgi:hypothetical protein